MKSLSLILVLFVTLRTYAYDCFCKNDKRLNLCISCDTIIFSNKSKLYRQFNCDSSWLTFENTKGIKKVLFSLEAPLIDYTERLGYQFEFEYKTTFLIKNRVISGCCTPPEYVLFNKQNGQIEKKLGRLIYYNKTKNKPFVAYLNQEDLNSIIIYNFETKKKQIITLQKDILINTVRQSEFMQAEDLFEQTIFSNGYLIFKYKFQKKGDTTKWYMKKQYIKI